jgi:hypothetical protein
MARDHAPPPDPAAEALAMVPPGGEALAPIDQIIDMLATSREPPAVAIGACLLRFDEAGPKLRAVLERAADGRLGDGEEELLFRAIHLLGGGRDPQSCRPLLRLLRRPPDELKDLLGDAGTATLPRIVAGVFDGDANALFEAIADRSIDEYIRWSLLSAAAFLAWEGRIAHDAMIAFLQDYDDQRMAEPGDAAWNGWQDAIGFLGLRALAPRVERMWKDGRMDPELVEAEYFEADLRRAETAPSDPARLDALGLGYIKDVYEELSRFGSRSDEEATDEDLLDWAARDFLPGEPYVNPMRHVGRNDPCPCGSGKKAKKCCLAG